MAAPSELSLDTWITDLSLLKASMEAGFLERCAVDSFVAKDYAEDVFRGINQFFYWSRRLQAASNVSVNTITFLGSRGLSQPDIGSIQDMIFNAMGPGNIIELNYCENSNFISIALKSQEAAQKMRELIVEVSGALVCYVSPRPPNCFRIRILWAPLFYDIQGLLNVLSPWCAKVVLHYEKETFSNGEIISTNRAMGNIILRDGLSLSELPHVVKLPDALNSYVLLIIKERPPLCLKCRSVGHIRRSCNQINCHKCGSLHMKNSDCPVKSYSMVAKGSSLLVQGAPLIVNQNKDSPLQSSGPQNDMSVGLMTLSSQLTMDGEASLPRSDKGEILSGADLQNDGFKIASRRVTRSMAKGAKGLKRRVPKGKSMFNHRFGLFNVLQDEAETKGRTFKTGDSSKVGVSAILSIADTGLPASVTECDLDEESGDSQSMSKHVKPFDVLNSGASSTGGGEVVMEVSSDWAEDVVDDRNSEGGGGSISVEADDLEEGADSSSVELPTPRLWFKGFSTSDRSAQVRTFLGVDFIEHINYLCDGLGERNGIFFIKNPSAELIRQSISKNGTSYEGKKNLVALEEFESSHT